jgi:flagellar basal-body rod modification protein FlgD
MEKASLNYDTFLKLMLEQLKSQDPTNPVDQKESLAQLASFSTVEQTIKLNSKLEAMQQRFSAVEASSLLGRKVSSLVSGETGIVVAVDVANSGSVAMLDTGKTVKLSDGLRITSA